MQVKNPKEVAVVLSPSTLYLSSPTTALKNVSLTTDSCMAPHQPEDEYCFHRSRIFMNCILQLPFDWRDIQV